MSEEYTDRQHVVNPNADAAGGDAAGPAAAEARGEGVRPPRSPAGEAFTSLVLEVAWLGGLFTAAGESLARLADQSLARWVVLDAVEDEPATVAHVARRRGIARQAVQRVADLLVRDGLAVYVPNPKDRRAQLLEPTPRGQKALRTISVAQKTWADDLGAQLGEAHLKRLASEIASLRELVSARPLPGRVARQRAPRSDSLR